MSGQIEYGYYDPGISKPPMGQPILQNQGTIINSTMDNDADKEICKVCLNNKINTVLVPCGHRCICEDCGKSLGASKKCPICRQKIQKVMKTFDA